MRTSREMTVDWTEPAERWIVYSRRKDMGEKQAPPDETYAFVEAFAYREAARLRRTHSFKDIRVRRDTEHTIDCSDVCNVEFDVEFTAEEPGVGVMRGYHSATVVKITVDERDITEHVSEYERTRLEEEMQESLDTDDEGEYMGDDE